MSDFLDRLAARAIGSESAGARSALAPRLPSLFEPLQRAPIMPLPDAGEASPGQHETVSEAPVAPTPTPVRSPRAPTMAATDASRIAAAAPEARPAPTPARAAAITPRAAVQPPASAHAPAPSSTVERIVVSPASTEVSSAPRPVRPRQMRSAIEQPGPATPPHPVQGALLSPAAPVFGATRAGEASGGSADAAAMRTPAAAVGQGHAAGEPIVHVSIGRIEVRAAPVAAASPRRRDGPQPSSLDDYLRQRGKAPP